MNTLQLPAPMRLSSIMHLLWFLIFAIPSFTVHVQGAQQVAPLEFDAVPAQLTSGEEAEISRLVLPPPAVWAGDFDGMQQRNFIRILVPYSKTFYSIDRGKEYGVDYDYGTALGKWLNKKYPTKVKNKQMVLVFTPVQRDKLLAELIAGRGDIAMGGLTVTEGRQKMVDFSAPFATDVKEVLVTAPGHRPVETFDDLAGLDITVRKSSSYFEHLQTINAQFKKQGKKVIRIHLADEWLESEDLLEMVNTGLIKATVVDRYLAHIWRQLFTEMQVIDSWFVNDGGELAWAIRKDSPKLKNILEQFMKEHRVGTTFGNIMVKRYVYDSSRVLNATSSAEMKKFAKLVDLFKTHCRTYDFDYLMLIAQGYQESQLNQKARSPRGAVGIMQILPSTAADPAINITGIDKDAGKNIEAGSKYLRLLTDKYLNDEGLSPVNRTLMAFAAYNAGPGNLRKFRRLAEKSGLDPDIWFQNVEYAAARIVGQETVKYVANIYKYYLAYQMALNLEENRR